MHNELTKNISAYFSYKREVIAVYLFGSYAEGKERPLSDIDICLLLDRTDHNAIKEIRNKYIVELSRVLRKDIHLVILNSAGEELIRQIFLKGRCILVSDPKKVSRYKMVMLTKIAEFAYYRTQMQGGLIRKVMRD